MTEVVAVRGREVLDSRGNPTVEVELATVSGFTGRAAGPSGGPPARKGAAGRGGGARLPPAATPPGRENLARWAGSRAGAAAPRGRPQARTRRSSCGTGREA